MAWAAQTIGSLLQGVHHPRQQRDGPNLPDACFHPQLQKHHQQQGSQEVHPCVQGGPDQAGGCSTGTGPAAAQANHCSRAEGQAVWAAQLA